MTRAEEVQWHSGALKTSKVHVSRILRWMDWFVTVTMTTKVEYRWSCTGAASGSSIGWSVCMNTTAAEEENTSISPNKETSRHLAWSDFVKTLHVCNVSILNGSDWSWWELLSVWGHTSHFWRQCIPVQTSVTLSTQREELLWNPRLIRS